MTVLSCKLVERSGIRSIARKGKSPPYLDGYTRPNPYMDAMSLNVNSVTEQGKRTGIMTMDVSSG